MAIGGNTGGTERHEKITHQSGKVVEIARDLSDVSEGQEVVGLEDVLNTISETKRKRICIFFVSWTFAKKKLFWRKYIELNKVFLTSSSP